MNKRRRILKSGLAMIISGGMFCCPMESRPNSLARLTFRTMPDYSYVAPEEKREIRTADELIRGDVLLNSEIFIRAAEADNQAPYFSSFLRTNGQPDDEKIKKMAERYWEGHKLMLDLAKKENPTEEDLRNTAVVTCNMQKPFSILVNYDDERVIRAQAELIKEKVGNFKRLRKTAPRAMSFAELNAKAYTPEEYVEYVARQIRTIRKFYGAMEDSAGLSRWLAKGEIQALERRAEWIYQESIERLFPSKNAQYAER